MPPIVVLAATAPWPPTPPRPRPPRQRLPSAPDARSEVVAAAVSGDRIGGIGGLLPQGPPSARVDAPLCGPVPGRSASADVITLRMP